MKNFERLTKVFDDNERCSSKEFSFWSSHKFCIFHKLIYRHLLTASSVGLKVLSLNFSAFFCWLWTRENYQKLMLQWLGKDKVKDATGAKKKVHQNFLVSTCFQPPIPSTSCKRNIVKFPNKVFLFSCHVVEKFFLGFCFAMNTKNCFTAGKCVANRLHEFWCGLGSKGHLCLWCNKANIIFKREN